MISSLFTLTIIILIALVLLPAVVQNLSPPLDRLEPLLVSLDHHTDTSSIMATQFKHLPQLVTMVSQQPKPTNSLSSVDSPLPAQQMTVKKKANKARFEVHLATDSTASPPSAKPILHISTGRSRRRTKAARPIVEPLYPSVFETSDSEGDEWPPMSLLGSPITTRPVAMKPNDGKSLTFSQ